MTRIYSSVFLSGGGGSLRNVYTKSLFFCYRGSQRSTAAALKKARTHQKNMSANMGGTEIFGALDFVYKRPLKPGYPRQVQWLFEF